LSGSRLLRGKVWKSPVEARNGLRKTFESFWRVIGPEMGCDAMQIRFIPPFPGNLDLPVGWLLARVRMDYIRHGVARGEES
jgi:hypothetical protein